MTTVTSFGYKFGNPDLKEGDMIFDIRKRVINPFKVCGDKTGLDPEVSKMVLDKGGEKAVREILERDLKGDVYIGCIGGRHRSVAVAEEVVKKLSERGVVATVKHRNIND